MQTSRDRARSTRVLGWPGIVGLMCLTLTPRIEASEVAYYRFEEGQGNEAIDSVGTADGTHGLAYSGDVPAAVIPRTGQPNAWSLRLDDVHQVTVPGAQFVLHAAYGDATLEFFVKVPNQGHSALFWTRPDANDTNRWNIYVNPSGVIAFDYRAPGAGPQAILVRCGGSLTVPLNTWTHVAAVRTVTGSGAHDYRFYRNGEEAGACFIADPSVNFSDPPDADTWTIGGRDGYRVEGFIDEVRFSDEALTPDRFLIAEPACLDVDGDGFSVGDAPECEPLDCDDSDPDVNPGMVEVPGNGVDDDCDPSTPSQGGCNPQPQTALAAAPGVLAGVEVPVDLLLAAIPSLAIVLRLQSRLRRPRR